MTTLELIRGYMDNQDVTINDSDVVRLEETAQDLGQILTGEGAIKHHLEILTQDNGAEWNGVEDDTLYNTPRELHPLLTYLGENENSVPVWYQGW